MSEKEPIRGKTKIIYEAFDNPGQVIIENTDAITAGDGARRDEIKHKSVLATDTACNVFELLHREGIETHFIERATPRRIRAANLIGRMIPLEVVVRSHAYGSFLERNPAMTPEQELGHLSVEYFAKDDHRHDPLLRYDHTAGIFNLYDPHKPQGHDSFMGFGPIANSPFALSAAEQEQIAGSAKRTFGILQEAWEGLGYLMIDLKMEYGRMSDGRVVLADTITNDEWRLWRDGDSSQMVDKQLYRNGAPLEEVAAAYAEVAAASSRFLQ